MIGRTLPFLRPYTLAVNGTASGDRSGGGGEAARNILAGRDRAEGRFRVCGQIQRQKPAQQAAPKRSTAKDRPPMWTAICILAVAAAVFGLEIVYSARA
jgi:hypothetical protein